ncbi:sensor histidine kinase [Biomaibacter acetigenes]|uniref:histidine kinase n=1 Tax=Biomaibacter acetigenes TaxID=2316383 RepID=A0A3G2R3S6_9FIRM|nr:HAMP domain-containing sensor histidine kinase [Biomaibacter acetigenes]AYO29778.1 sensor histidine kinase [Biomaibacter acetigenes]
MKNLTIRTKMTLWYSFMLLVLLSIFSFFVYILMSRMMYSGEESLIKAHAAQAISVIELENGRIKFAEPNELMTSGTYIFVYDKKGQMIFGSKGIYPEINMQRPSEEKLRVVNIKDDAWIIYDRPVYEENKLVAWVRASRSLASVRHALENLRDILVVTIPLFLIIAAGGGLFLANRALAPIDRITKTARAIGRGDLSRRLNMPKVEDEVGRLAMTFDEMLDRLETSFKKERQFTSDASHELRTPLAVIRALAEETLMGARSEEEFRDTLEDILKETTNMQNMVSQLLLLTRGDEGRYQLEMENIDLKIVIEDVMGEMEAMAGQYGVNLYFQAEKSVVVKGDQTLLTRLFMNLIDNAIKYNTEGGWVKVTLHEAKGFARIIVKDSGIGIPKEDIPHVFDRFYRVDRSRSSDGTGLGLSIVQWIVKIHNGQIYVKSRPGEGTEFEILLPL